MAKRVAKTKFGKTLRDQRNHVGCGFDGNGGIRVARVNPTKVMQPARPQRGVAKAAKGAQASL